MDSETSPKISDRIGFFCPYATRRRKAFIANTENTIDEADISEKTSAPHSTPSSPFIATTIMSEARAMSDINDKARAAIAAPRPLFVRGFSHPTDISEPYLGSS